MSQDNTTQTHEVTYFAVGAHCWGRGRSETEAIRNMVASNAGKPSRYYTARIEHSQDDIPYVDSVCGSIVYIGRLTDRFEYKRGRLQPAHNNSGQQLGVPS